MPRGNGNGPRGTGPMTGRAAGYCVGNEIAGFMDEGGGWGLGPKRHRRGRGRRQGRRGGLPAEGSTRRFFTGKKRPSPDDGPAASAAFSDLQRTQGVDILKRRAEILRQTLKDVQTRIADLDRSE